MPTQEEYKERLQPLLAEAFAPQRTEMRAPSSVDTVRRSTADERVSLNKEEADRLATDLGKMLAELETQNVAAHAGMTTLMAAAAKDNKGSRMASTTDSTSWPERKKYALGLDCIHNPPEALLQEIEALPELHAAWKAMAAVAPQSTFEPRSIVTRLAPARAVADNGMVMCDKWGTIYGTGKYENLDVGWAWTLKNNVMNHFPKWLGHCYGVADFVRRDAWKERVQLQPSSDGKVRIAIVGDWGAGAYELDGLAHPGGPACAVMDTLGNLLSPPDYIVHLGDTYYSGTGVNRSPESEETDNLLKILKRYPKLAKNGKCFALNSNHEMYGGAYGYYTALSNPLFSKQKGCSYFALEFGDWILVGLDSAYYDPSVFYKDGGLGEQSDNPQYEFLKKIKAAGKKVILMSHHSGISTNGEELSALWNDVTSVLHPDYWYWGHLHLGVFYSPKACSGRLKTRCRCIGHSSMPFAVPPGMESCKNVDWYSKTPLVSSATSASYSRPRAKNGFALLTLSEHGITEEVYEIGNTKPVWHV